MQRPGYKVYNRPGFEPRFPRQIKKQIIQPPTPPDSGWSAKLLQWGPVAAGFLTVGATIFFATFGSSIAGNNLQLVITVGIAMGFGSFLMGLGVYVSNRKARQETRKYLNYLKALDQEIEVANRHYVVKLNEIDPPPAELVKLVDEGRGRYLWERQPSHQNFLKVRIGLEPDVAGAYLLEPPSSFRDSLNVSELDEAAKKLHHERSTVPAAPGLISLKKAEVFGIAGLVKPAYELACALLAQIAVHHSPEDVRLVVLASPERAAQWFWMGWLPHTQPLDSTGTRPNVVGEHEDLKNVIENLRETLRGRQEKLRGLSEAEKAQALQPYIVVLIDATDKLSLDRTFVQRLLREGADLNMLTIYLAKNPGDLPNTAHAYVNLLAEGLMELVTSKDDGSGEKANWQADSLSQAAADVLARELAPLQLAQKDSAQLMPAEVHFFDLLDWPTFNAELLARHWSQFSTANLELMLGQAENAQPLFINLDEGVHGTHGVIVGATGSGKGELLLTLVTSLALNNHPSRLNFVLADFKGGATFRSFEKLPHTVGIVTDQVDEFGLSRFLASIEQELKRRKTIIDAMQRRYGSRIQKIRDLEKVAPDEAFPFLLVIIDEFAELARSAPEMMDKLVVIAQQGRSLGVFLLLSMQTTEALKGAIEKNLRYRIALRMSQKSDSKELIGDECAASINGKNRGRGYFRCDDELVMFQTARVMGQSRSLAPVAETAPTSAVPVRPLALNWQAVGSETAPVMEVTNNGQPDLEVAIEACRQALERVPLPSSLFVPWLPPLAATLPLASYLDAPASLENFSQWPPEKAWLRVPIAQMDKFWEQSQPVLYSEFSQGRNLQFAGVQDTGRSLALLSTVTALAVTHRPEELAFVMIDFGTSLGVFKNLPHQVDYYGGSEFQPLAECLKELTYLLERRRELFGRAGVANLEAYQTYQKRQGVRPAEQMEAVMVVIDNYTSWAQSHPNFFFDVLPDIKNLARDGGAYGIHFIVTSEKPADLAGGQLAANFQTILLRMDASELGVLPYDRRILAAWQGRSGRGFIQHALPYNLVELQCFVPYPVAENAQLGRLQQLVEELNAAFKVTCEVGV